jgi:hypothetical protein
LDYFAYLQKYKLHLESDYWQEVRRRVWQRATGSDGWAYCERCGRILFNTPADVHHLRYGGVVFRELEGDNLRFLQLVCRDPCHKRAHSKE